MPDHKQNSQKINLREILEMHLEGMTNNEIQQFIETNNLSAHREAAYLMELSTS